MAKTRVFWCLLGVNLALLVAVVFPRLRENTAMAQAPLRPADYLLIPGEVSGGDRGVVYIIDGSNRLLSAVAFQDSTGRIDVMQPIDLDRTFSEGEGDRDRGRRR